MVAQGLLIAAITLSVVGLPAIERELGGGTAGMGALNSAYGVSFRRAAARWRAAG